MTLGDLRNRYGITQLAFDLDAKHKHCEQALKLRHDFIILATGKVIERHSKNATMNTDDIEILVTKLSILDFL